jgi:hypothetical protein
MLLIAIGCVSRKYQYATAIIAVLLGLWVFGRLAGTVRLRNKEIVEYMVEPSTNWEFSRNPKRPLEPFAKPIAESATDQPLVVRFTLDFLYIYHYAPPEVRKRLYPVSLDKRDEAYRLNKAVREWCHVDLNVEQPIDQFMATHKDFYLFGSVRDFYLLHNIFQHPGVSITSFKSEANSHFLLHIHVAAPWG